MGLLVVIAVVILGYRSLASSSSPASTSLTDASPLAQPSSRAPSSPLAGPIELIRRQDRGRLGEADGVVPDGVTVFDDGYPAVARLDPALLEALRQAATNARDDGIVLIVDSGWRSRNYQEQLFEQAVSKYGSAEKAAQWVARPGTSAHELGQAVDIGPSDGARWLSDHGAAYGLCQIYRDEPWHYELRPRAVDEGCPPMYADPTQDPRMQR